MSIFSGKFHKLPGVKGKLTDQTPELRATMEQVDNGPKATVNRVAGITGAFYRMGRWLKAAVRPLDILYRFLTACQMVRQTHSAQVSTAPAVEIEANSTFRSGRKVPLSAQPVADLKVDQNGNPSVHAKLVAYRRAGCRYIKKLFFKTTAKLQAACSAVAKYTKALKFKLTAKAIAAESAIIESRFNKLQTGCEATGSSAPAHIVPAIENTFIAEHTATASTGAALTVGINQLLRAVHHAPLASWFFPEQDGNTLRFYQVFSGVQSGNVLEVDLETESVYWANAKVTDGTLNLVFAETATPNDTILEVV